MLLLGACQGETSWLFDTPICTGLGDRLGMILSLSALAHLNNSTAWMEWCHDAQRVSVLNPMHLAYIPGWTGWQYPLETVLNHITFPSNVKFFSDGHRPATPYELVRLNHLAPAVQGIPQTSTLYWKAFKFSDRQWPAEDYRRAYMEAGRGVNSKKTLADPYVLAHFRCPDHNTHRRDETSFCTRKVFRRLGGMRVRVISNNHTLTSMWLQGVEGVQIMDQGTAWDDMQLILGASAIVQHASEGWSSYSSVPAMAKGIPLINTYKGGGHRYSFFLQHGDLPPEFFTCRQIRRFVEKTASLAALQRNTRGENAFSAVY